MVIDFYQVLKFISGIYLLYLHPFDILQVLIIIRQVNFSEKAVIWSPGFDHYLPIQEFG